MTTAPLPHNTILPNALELALTERMRTFIDPLTGADWVSTRQIKSLTVQDGTAVLDISLAYPARSQWPAYTELITQHLMNEPSISNIQVNWSTSVTAHASPPGIARVAGVKNLLAVASGKGGVGKSTTAVNLALALQAEGARVGLLDADIYGPSQPTMLGLAGKPESPDGKTMLPLMNHGIQMMSMGLLIAEQAPTIWRGPMATQGLDQLLRLTRWGYLNNDNTLEPLDYLLVDMPPGTGDIHLSICQRAPLTAACIVTTPQDIALLDATKGLRMFEKMNIPVLGIIENMAVYHCPACGHEAHIFGSLGGAKMASNHQVKLLGSLPLSLQIREDADSGHPTVISEPDSATTQLYLNIARQLAAQLSLLPKDYSSKIPAVIAQN